MASIVKRNKKFAVVYTYIDDSGSKRQKWETFDSSAEAKRRKAQVEFEQHAGTFVIPTSKTVRELLTDYMAIYGVNTWSVSTYKTNRGLILNYVDPIIGDLRLDSINPRVMDKYYRDLLTVRTVSVNNVKPRNEFLTAHTVHAIHKVLRNAFNQAVKWELMARNPVENATLPKAEYQPRDIWTADILFKAIEVCDNETLKLAMNLAFSCSLRMGEMLGLTWDCVDITPASINAGRASIYIDKELQRVNRELLEQLGEKGVRFKFPPALHGNRTALVLKEPKTKTSVRRVFLPKTVAEMLVERKAKNEKMKSLLGTDFLDYNLVFCTSTGRPVEGQVIDRTFEKLIQENGFPKVVFHSLRHSSITYKLKLNGGDMKSVQGDSGHAQIKMVADVYSHIIDDDRRLNAQRFEDAFYSRHQQDTPEDSTPLSENEITLETLRKLLANPDAAALLKSLTESL
ncbi:MAG: site-specific integrase [Lachnospiraceae bacterium]|nr:site-specific integrase [Lachnospiraceae bacterium]